MASPNMSCPLGGDFYACADGSHFVGCCGRNPCGGTGCAAGNLVPTSFDSSQYGQFADQQCSAGSFFTCTGTNPPFWGCCESNPCVSGSCPSTDLSGAFLSSNPPAAAPFLSLNDTVSSTSTITSVPSTSSTSSPSDSTPTPTPVHHSSTNTGAIAGGVVGGIAVLALFVFGLLWLNRRRKRSIVSETTHQENHQYQNQEMSTAPTWAGREQHSHAYKMSPVVSSYQSSPSLPQWSPKPPSYWSEPQQQHISHELPGSDIQTELDGGGIRSSDVK